MKVVGFILISAITIYSYFLLRSSFRQQPEELKSGVQGLGLVLRQRELDPTKQGRNLLWRVTLNEWFWFDSGRDFDSKDDKLDSGSEIIRVGRNDINNHNTTDSNDNDNQRHSAHSDGSSDSTADEF